MIEIVPAIDIIEGKCVRLSKGDYNTKKIYNENPLEVAKMFEAEGIKRLHVVDLDGAKEKKIINHKTLEKITSNTGLIVDFGGGLKTDEDLRIAFECGAKMITGGSIAVKDKPTFEQWIKKYGSDKVILGADVKDEKISVGGWLDDTNIDLDSFLEEYSKKGITKVISTDISKDGMLTGPSVGLYKRILTRFPHFYIIASGGVSKIEDIEELEAHGIHSVIIGKAIYEGRILLKDLNKFFV